MNRLADRSACTGCGACADACAHGAVGMREDADGFAFPAIDVGRCVACGACSRVCPALNRPPRADAAGVAFFAAQLRETSELDRVSSGGAFWALAQRILADGGVVYGSCLESVTRVGHRRAESVDEARALRRSKYLPSDMSGVYRRIRADVRGGRVVLFCGTGCQVAAVRTFVGAEAGGLVTCEVVCHGIPSMRAWRTFLAELEVRENARVAEVVFRDKSRGWRTNQYRIALEDGRELKEPSVCHPFHLGYLLGLFYRRSCGRCAYAGLPRIADLTLADFWKYSGRAFGPTIDRGVSLVLANTPRGRALLEASSAWLAVEPVSSAEALASCRNLSCSPHENPNREGFLATLRKRGYRAAARRYFKFGENRRCGWWMRLFWSCADRLRRNGNETMR